MKCLSSVALNEIHTGERQGVLALNIGLWNSCPGQTSFAQCERLSFCIVLCGVEINNPWATTQYLAE